MTVSATGAELRVSVILIMRIKNGLIASVRDYTDNLTIASLGPPPVG